MENGVEVYCEAGGTDAPRQPSGEKRTKTTYAA